MIRSLAILLATACACFPADVLELKAGKNRKGRILSMDEKFIRLEIELPKQAVQSTQPLASIAIPRGDVLAIDFSPSPDREAAIRSASVQDLPALEENWKKFRPWLEMPRSPSGSIACALGDALLATKTQKNAKRALELFALVEKSAWQESDRAIGREGRLRAMSATGKAAQAVKEAKSLAAETEDPEILIDANYLMAQAAAKELQNFIKENPRWNMDQTVIDERHRLQNRALELYLHPALFFGSESSKAARGLWGAVGVYLLAAKNGREAEIPDLEKFSTNLAIETCRDIVAFYPATPESKLATDLLATFKPDQLAVDFEAEGRTDLHHPAANTPTPPPENSPTPKTERIKKKHEKK